MTSFEPSDDLAQRAAVHAALGDPVRLAIVDELVRSDRTPSELARRFGLASNLLAHHVGILERVGLVERSVSSGDRRRRYVRALPAALAAVAASSITSVASTATIGPHALFVCTHNSARSQLAAALWRHRTGTSADSAGTHPADLVHPGAVAAASRLGLDLTASAPRELAPDELDEADLVITVCDRAHEEITLPDTALHWSIPDPVGAEPAPGGIDPFEDAAALLDRRITATVALSASPDRSPA